MLLCTTPKLHGAPSKVFLPSPKSPGCAGLLQGTVWEPVLLCSSLGCAWHHPQKASCAALQQPRLCLAPLQEGPCKPKTPEAEPGCCSQAVLLCRIESLQMPPQQAALPSPKSTGCTRPPQQRWAVLLCTTWCCMVPHQRSFNQARNPQTALGCCRAQHGSLCCSEAARTVSGTTAAAQILPGTTPKKLPASPEILELQEAAAASLSCSAEA